MEGYACLSLLLVYTVMPFHQCIDLPEVLTVKERIEIFGTNKSTDLPHYQLASLEELNVDTLRPLRKHPAHVVQYRLILNDERMTLTLTQNPDLISPGCIVHHYAENGSKTIYPCGRPGCFYTGRSDAHNESWVAVDVCDGLKGVITYSNRSLFISPLKKRHPSDNARDFVHVVYRYHGNKQVCATKDAGERFHIIRPSKRAANRKYLEVGVVVDPSMFRFYNQTTDEGGIEKYVSTMFNVAARLYQDTSLGTKIRLTLKEIHIVETYDVFKSDISADAKQSLINFCKWQGQPSNSLSTSDASVLLTRLDIYVKGNNGKSAVGFANTGAVCQQYRKCAVVQDGGPASGFTMAHEIGHLLGMNHDKNGSGCHGIMSAFGASGRQAYTWSPCSAGDIARFLSSASNGRCLHNEPAGLPTDRQIESMPKPGTLYTIDDQCELTMGTKACPWVVNASHPCGQLNCASLSGNTCPALTQPLLDGTDCANNTRKWCMKGECVDMPASEPSIHGGWSNWDAEYAPCSRSCGGGVRTLRRRCDNPPPQFGGKSCVGEALIAKLCNVQPCQGDYRKDQCAAINSYYSGKYQWRPNYEYTGPRPCVLHCIGRDNTTGLERIVDGDHLFPNGGAAQYADGTECSIDQFEPFSRCVDGVCRRFGCDGHMNSPLQYDQCGKCNGTGNTCREIHGHYHRQEPNGTFTTVLMLRSGSSGVVITQNNTYCFLSVFVEGRRLFNHKEKGHSYTFHVGDVQMKYTRNPEKIEIAGPTTKAIAIQVYRRYDYRRYGDQVTPYVDYVYHYPDNTNTPNEYVWSVRNTGCSKTCGTGTNIPLVKCMRFLEVMPDYLCDLATKPSEHGNKCNDFPCPPEWQTTDWNPCSVTCGVGVKTRSVHCVHETKGNTSQVYARNCDASSKPNALETCKAGDCPGVWKVGAWSACSVTCSQGMSTRHVRCFHTANASTPTDDNYCNRSAKPGSTKLCMARACSSTYDGSKCGDKAQKSQYGADFCVGQFRVWASVNLMKSCGFCDSCTDDATCPEYGPAICTNKFRPWAITHCPRMCYTCGECKDSHGTPCGLYDTKFCSQDLYRPYLWKKCPRHCGFCR